jgi:hypothetical protein
MASESGSKFCIPNQPRAVWLLPEGGKEWGRGVSGVMVLLCCQCEAHGCGCGFEARPCGERSAESKAVWLLPEGGKGGATDYAWAHHRTTWLLCWQRLGEGARRRARVRGCWRRWASAGGAGGGRAGRGAAGIGRLEEGGRRRVCARRRVCRSGGRAVRVAASGRGWVCLTDEFID